jgi:uncharacterized protein (TIGR02246 family)
MSHPPILVLALGLLVLPAAGCGPGPAERAPATAAGAPAPLSAADQAAIRATDTAFATAAGAGDAASVAAIYLPDARLMPPNAPTIQGRDAIQQFWGGFLGTYALKIEVTAEEVEGRGDLAYARGRYVLDATPKVKGPGPLHEVGKFLEILRRQPDGSWRYVVDMYSSDAPAPE